MDKVLKMQLIMYTKSIDKENKYYIFIYSQNKTMLPFIMYHVIVELFYIDIHVLYYIFQV